MMLWLVHRDGPSVLRRQWLVRARSREEALALVFGAESPEGIDVIEMPHEGDPAILWESAEPGTDE